MRKNTQKLLATFVAGLPMREARDSIIINDKRVVWALHGHPIAIREGHDLILSTCGWNTPKTWGRLHAIASHYGVHFSRRESIKHERQALQIEAFTIKE